MESFPSKTWKKAKMVPLTTLTSRAAGVLAAEIRQEKDMKVIQVGKK